MTDTIAKRSGGKSVSLTADFLLREFSAAPTALSAASASGVSDSSSRKIRSVPDIISLSGLLHLEREAVRALTYCGVSLMCADLDFVEGAVILAAAVMLAVVDCTANVLVCKFSSHI